MTDLLESILNKDLVSAKEIFESRMDVIAEKKLYEAKRRLSAELHEGLVGRDPKTLRAKGYRKATDVLGDPTASRKGGKQSEPQKGKGDDFAMQLQKVRQGWKSAKFGERRQAVRMVHKAAKDYAASQKVKEPEAPKQPEAPKAPERKPSRVNALDWMTKAGRRRELEKKREQKVSSLKSTNPERAARLQTALDSAAKRDTRNKIGKVGGETLRAVGSTVGRGLRGALGALEE